MDMTITKTQRDLLIGLLGVLAAVLVWFLVASPYKQKAEALKTENEELKPKYEEYQEVVANIEDYRTRIIDADAAKEEIIAHFPSYLEREDQIMYWATAAGQFSEDMMFSNLGMGPWTLVQVDGVSGTEEQQVDVELDEEGNPIVSDTPAISSSNYELYTDKLQMDFQTTYDGLKHFTQYVLDQSNRNKIEKLEVHYDQATENLMGNMDLALYYLTGTGKEYVEYNPVPHVVTGASDLFLTGYAPLNLEAIGEDQESESKEGEEAESSEEAED
jgi:hypothetical protein